MSKEGRALANFAVIVELVIFRIITTTIIMIIIIITIIVIIITIIITFYSNCIIVSFIVLQNYTPSCLMCLCA